MVRTCRIRLSTPSSAAWGPSDPGVSTYAGDLEPCARSDGARLVISWSSCARLGDATSVPGLCVGVHCPNPLFEGREDRCRLGNLPISGSSAPGVAQDPAPNTPV